MKLRPSAPVLLFVACFALVIVRPVWAGILYENGPINGETDAWTINFGFVVSDSFTISTGTSTVNGMSFGAWLFPGDTLESAEVTLSSQPDSGTIYFDGTVSFTQSGCFLNHYNYDICTETSIFNGPNLANGTYWVSLQNAVDTNNEPVYWDENSGVGCHSPGCPSLAAPGSGEGTLPSEAFTILGSANSGGSTPEPTSLLLFASGVLGIAGLINRKLP